MDAAHADLTAAWHQTQASLPSGWTLDSLRCASTGLGVATRSDDWVAIAIGPEDQQIEHRATDALSALDGLAAVVADSLDA